MHSQNLHIKSFVAQSKPAGKRTTTPQHIYLLPSDYINQHCSHFDRLHLLPRCSIELPPHRLKLLLAVKYRFVVSAKNFWDGQVRYWNEGRSCQAVCPNHHWAPLNDQTNRSDMTRTSKLHLHLSPIEPFPRHMLCEAHGQVHAISTQLRGLRCYRLRHRWCLDGV